jgi:signal transduction histidine kinase
MAPSRLRILVVEDDRAALVLLSAQLDQVARAHFVLGHAATLSEALEMLAGDRWHVVLLDLSLPDSFGAETLRAVCKAAPDVAVVVLTGLDDERAGLTALKTGAQDYLVKGRADGELVWRAARYAIERKRAAEALRALNAELEARVAERTRDLAVANEDLEGFVFSASHDLRTHVRSIAGLAEMLRQDHADALGDEGRDLTERLRRAAGRLDECIQALLRLSQLGHRAVRRERVDLAEVARGVVKRLREAEAARRVEVVVPDTLPADADPTLIEVVVENLLSNAWKFTTPRDPGRIEIGREGDAWFVRDDGIGFDPALADRLFRPFQRLHPRDALAGTGLGLVGVRRVVRMHGGDVRAEGRPDGGATFWFTLG